MIEAGFKHFLCACDITLVQQLDHIPELQQQWPWYVPDDKGGCTLDLMRSLQTCEFKKDHEPSKQTLVKQHCVQHLCARAVYNSVQLALTADMQLLQMFRCDLSVGTFGSIPPGHSRSILQLVRRVCVCTFMLYGPQNLH